MSRLQFVLFIFILMIYINILVFWESCNGKLPDITSWLSFSHLTDKYSSTFTPEYRRKSFHFCLVEASMHVRANKSVTTLPAIYQCIRSSSTLKSRYILCLQTIRKTTGKDVKIIGLWLASRFLIKLWKQEEQDTRAIQYTSEVVNDTVLK